MTVGILQQLAILPQPTFIQALAGWSAVWVAIVSLPPGGHSVQANIIYMNMAHGFVAALLSTLTILTDSDSTFSTAASVSFFIVDALVMLHNGVMQKKNKTSNSPGRWMDYLHHVIGAVYGSWLLFRQGTVCSPTCPAKNLYTYAQTNEISTPLYGVYRLTKNPVAGALFALVFFMSRIIFNFIYLVPYSLRHCSLVGFLVIAFPYQLLQVTWMFFMIKKIFTTLSGGRAASAEAEQTRNGKNKAVESK